MVDLLKRLVSLAVPGGFTAGDLGRIPGPNTALIDGALIYREPQSNFHTVTVSLLVFG